MLEIVGDSHIIAMVDAMNQPGKSSTFSSRHGPIRMGQLGHGYNFLEPFFSFNDDGVYFTQPPAHEIFSRMNRDGSSSIVRNDPRRFIFVFGLYPSFGFNAEHWTKHSAATWSKNRQFVSKSAFNKIIDNVLQEPMSFFHRLKEINVKFSVASCCPVPASYQHNTNNTVFAENEVAHIYNSFRDRAVNLLTSMGVTTHLPPDEVYDVNGAMLDKFSKSPRDYHANPAYGRLMLEKILSEVDTLH